MVNAMGVFLFGDFTMSKFVASVIRRRMAYAGGYGNAL